MDNTETGKLFLLLAQLWPNKKISDHTKLAWGLVLEPYRYADVRAAAIAYAAKHKYFPDVADLTAGLEPEEGQAEEDALRWMDRYITLRDNAPGLGRISRMARERGISWEEAARDA